MRAVKIMDPHIPVKVRVRAMDHLTGVKIKAMDLILEKIKTKPLLFRFEIW